MPSLAATSPQQRPSFAASVARVRVDVIATDAEGRFVDDLGPGEFVLYEDGVEQRILGTQIVDLAGGTIAEMVPARASRSLSDSPGPANVRTRPVPAAASRDFGAMIFLVDLPGLDRRNKDRFAEAWLEVLDESALLGIPRAVYMIDQLGRLQELAPLTLSVEALREAVETVRDAPLVRRGVHDRLVRVAADILAEEGLDFLAAEASDLNEIRVSEAEERARSRRTLELLTQFCNALSARQGRTALVWVSSAIQLAESGPGTALAAAYATSDPGFDAGTIDRSRRTGDTLFAYLSIDTRIAELQRTLHHAANSANVSIYTLDPMPEAEHRSMPIDMRVRGPALAELLSSSIVQTSLDGLKDALWQAADETGGKASIGATELDAALRRIDADTSRFYLLSYEPPEPHGDGEFHAIRVEVRRPGVSIRQRNGYVDLTPEQRESRALEAALVLPGAVTALPVDVRAFRGWSAAGEPVVKLVVGLVQDLAQLEIGPPELLSHRIHAVALDRDGTVADEVSQRMTPTGAPTQRMLSGGRPTVYMHDWPLPPGSYDLRVAVRDGDRGGIGAASLAVEVPEPSRGWSASDLMLAVAGADGAPQPLLSGWIYADEALFTYIEVRGGGDPRLSGRILDAGGDAELVVLPETRLAEDSRGIHRGALRMRSLTAGDYTLEIVLNDAAAGESRTFRVPLQVLGS